MIPAEKTSKKKEESRMSYISGARSVADEQCLKKKWMELDRHSGSLSIRYQWEDKDKRVN